MPSVRSFSVAVSLVLCSAVVGRLMAGLGQAPPSSPPAAGGVSEEASLEELASQLLPKLDLPGDTQDASGLSHPARKGLRLS
jgi:hypothetical protein